MFVLHDVGMISQEQKEPTLKFLTLTGKYPISEKERPFAFSNGVHGKWCKLAIFTVILKDNRRV